MCSNKILKHVINIWLQTVASSHFLIIYKIDYCESMNPNINIYQSIIKQRIELAWSLKLLELQTQLIPDNQVLLNQNNQTQLLKNLINFNGIGNLANLGGLRTNNILQNPLLSLLGSNLTTSPLFSQNTFNINELFHINNTDSRNLNQNQVNESIKPIEKPQQKSELNKTKSNSEISKKIKYKCFQSQDQIKTNSNHYRFRSKCTIMLIRKVKIKINLKSKVNNQYSKYTCQINSKSPQDPQIKIKQQDYIILTQGIIKQKNTRPQTKLKIFQCKKYQEFYEGQKDFQRKNILIQKEKTNSIQINQKRERHQIKKVKKIEEGSQAKLRIQFLCQYIQRRQFQNYGWIRLPSFHSIILIQLKKPF